MITNIDFLVFFMVAEESRPNCALIYDSSIVYFYILRTPFLVNLFPFIIRYSLKFTKY